MPTHFFHPSALFETRQNGTSDRFGAEIVHFGSSVSSPGHPNGLSQKKGPLLSCETVWLTVICSGCVPQHTWRSTHLPRSSSFPGQYHRWFPRQEPAAD